MQDFESPKNRKVKLLDLVAAGLFSIITLVVMTGYDISQHDSFIAPSYADCGDPNGEYYDSNFCKTMLEKTRLKVPLTQFAYEFTERETYWIWMQVLIFSFAGVFWAARWMMGSPLAGFLWALTGVLPIFAGYEDFLYYALRGMDIPGELPWLNNNVIIGIVTGVLYGEGVNVTSTSLYVSMAIVPVILGVVWFLTLREQDPKWV